MALNLNPISGITKEVIGGLDAIFTSDEERMTAQAKIAEIMQKPHVLQAMANIQEARHKSVFVAGWRPMIGWICAIGIGHHFIFQPLLAAILAVYVPDVTLPSLDTGELMTLVLSLLGLGGMRSYEKKNKVASDSMSANTWADD